MDYIHLNERAVVNQLTKIFLRCANPPLSAVLESADAHPT